MLIARHLENIQDRNYNELIYDKYDIISEIELRIIRLHERIYFRAPDDEERRIRDLRERVSKLSTDLGSMALTSLCSTEDLLNKVHGSL
jgi:hypothetical protein